MKNMLRVHKSDEYSKRNSEWAYSEKSLRRKTCKNLSSVRNWFVSKRAGCGRKKSAIQKTLTSLWKDLLRDRVREFEG